DETGTRGNISADPLFVDAASGNFRLEQAAPPIDAGTNTGAPPTDFDGNPRPIDGDGDGVAVTDMGAFEFPAADLALAKTARPDPVSVGDTITYTLTVRNNGPA